MELKGIGFENFRVFHEKYNFEIAPITILTGTNSSGKSTFIKGLKLFQNFWAQSGFGHNLEFENGSHQLGDFELILSKTKKDNLLKVSYNLDHILYDIFTIELIFELNDKNILKNGILIESRILVNDTIIFSVILDKEVNRKIYYNNTFIIETLIPDLVKKSRKLQIEFKRINNSLDKNRSESAILFIDDALKSSNISTKRYYQLSGLFEMQGIDNTGNGTPLLNLINFKDTKLIFDLQILNILKKINVPQSGNILYDLWYLLIEYKPEISDRFDIKTFIDFIDKKENESKLNFNIWQESFLHSGEKSFTIFLKKQLKLATQIISSQYHSLYGFMGIKDYENLGYKFYTQFSILEIWKNFCQKIKEIKNLTIEEQAVVNSYFIIKDALFLENLLFEPNSTKSEGTNKNIFFHFNNIIEELFSSIKFNHSKMYFIDSVRAIPQRFFSVDIQNSDFNRFILDFLKVILVEKEEMFLKKWLKEFEIADNIEISYTPGIGSQIFFINKDEKINLVDLGYGVTQFLPIILKIVFCKHTNKKTIIIEEPETNLHPKFQSKLADLFADAVKTFDIHFIVETHSEYLIRKIQILTSKRIVNIEDTLIYYIENENHSSFKQEDKKIKKIQIQQNGRLSTPFGSGFYDEADNLSLILLDLSLN